MAGCITHRTNDHKRQSKRMSGLSNSCSLHLDCQDIRKMLFNLVNLVLSSDKAISRRNQADSACLLGLFQHCFHLLNQVATGLIVEGLPCHLTIVIAKSCHIHIMVDQTICHYYISDFQARSYCSSGTRIDDRRHLKIIG